MGWRVSCCRPVYVNVCHLLLKLLLLCQVESDFDAARYEWYEDKSLQSYRSDFEYFHELC